jgi:hypothetical protein
MQESFLANDEYNENVDTLNHSYYPLKVTLCRLFPGLASQATFQSMTEALHDFFTTNSANHTSCKCIVTLFSVSFDGIFRPLSTKLVESFH